MKESLEALKGLRLLDDDWNGHGAKKCNNQVIDIAHDIVQCTGWAFDKVSPDGDGGLEMKFSDGIRIVVFKEQ